jgi:hypothetical protein
MGLMLVLKLYETRAHSSAAPTSRLIQLVHADRALDRDRGQNSCGLRLGGYSLRLGGHHLWLGGHHLRLGGHHLRLGSHNLWLGRGDHLRLGHDHLWRGLMLHHGRLLLGHNRLHAGLLDESVRYNAWLVLNDSSGDCGRGGSIGGGIPRLVSSRSPRPVSSRSSRSSSFSSLLRPVSSRPSRPSRPVGVSAVIAAAAAAVAAFNTTQWLRRVLRDCWLGPIVAGRRNIIGSVTFYERIFRVLDFVPIGLHGVGYQLAGRNRREQPRRVANDLLQGLARVQ